MMETDQPWMVNKFPIVSFLSFWQSESDVLQTSYQGGSLSSRLDCESYMQKAGDTCDISPQFFLDFPQNFRLRTRNQYCTQAIAWGSTILDGGSTILDGSSTIFCRFSPFFVDFHHFSSIFTIYALLSRFTHFFRKSFFGQNSLLRNITRFLHVWNEPKLPTIKPAITNVREKKQQNCWDFQKRIARAWSKLNIENVLSDLLASYYF